MGHRHQTLKEDAEIRSQQCSSTAWAAFDESGIGIASATFDIVGLPPLQVEKAERVKADGQMN